MSFIARSALRAPRLALAPSIARTRLSALSAQLSSPPNRSFLRTMATSLPKTMKGVWIEKTGGTEVLQYKEDIPVPELKDGEVLVKNEFIGINYIDTYIYPHLPTTPRLTKQ
jgi:NADPH2:quinone reductase